MDNALHENMIVGIDRTHNLYAMQMMCSAWHQMGIFFSLKCPLLVMWTASTINRREARGTAQCCASQPTRPHRTNPTRQPAQAVQLLHDEAAR